KRFRIGEKCRDLGRNVGARKRFRIRAEALREPIEQQSAVRVGKIDRRLMFLRDELRPPFPAQRKESVIVDPVAIRAVLSNDIPTGTVGPLDFRTRSSILPHRGKSEDQRKCEKESHAKAKEALCWSRKMFAFQSRVPPHRTLECFQCCTYATTREACL